MKRGAGAVYLAAVHAPPSGPVGARCLVVDDDARVRRAVGRIIEAHGLATLEASSGVEALAVLAREGEVPLCISDIYMPEMDGLTFLREALERYPDMAVVMLTGVADVTTAVECLKLGALDYIAKPVMVEEVRARVDKALEKRDLVLQNRFYQKHLESRVRELDQRNRQALVNGVQTLVHALEAKDAYTSGHSSRVSRYAVKTAVQLGYTGELLEQIRLGGELHDIGKIGIPSRILAKAGPLTAEERALVETHPVLGERILAPIEQLGEVRLIVRCAHEHYDGTGYPDRLFGDQIPLESRIVLACDAFHAMTTDRPYRKSLGEDEAKRRLIEASGAQFDPQVVDALLRVLGD